MDCGYKEHDNEGDKMKHERRKIDPIAAKIKKAERRWLFAGIKDISGKPLTWNTYEEVKRLQDNKCAICERNSLWGELQVDHDHRTGLFRGLLCVDCNHYAVGTFERTGKYKDRKMEDAIREYLDNPPYRKYCVYKEGVPIAEVVR